jgi:Zn-dependent M28 family amino/carboxypeptidase
MSRRKLLERRMLCMLGSLLVLALGALLTGCGGGEEAGDEGVGNAQTAAARPAREDSVAKAPVSNAATEAATSIDEASIRTDLDRLTGASSAPLSSGNVTITERGSEAGRRAAAQYMEESFEAMQIPARTIEFTLDRRRGYNVEATLEGTGGEKHLWVTAHLDSVYNAGASDDASGLAAILEIAKALKQIKPEQTVHFVAYDLEEIGLYGSSRYVDSVVSETRKREGEQAIIGDINIDMIGYDGGGFEAVMGSCNQAGPLDDAVLRASKAIDSPIKLTDDCLARSDHQNFWDAGFPALLITDGTKYDDYPWYHKTGDTIDKLNIPYLRSMIQLTAASAALLVAPENESS